MTRFFSSIVLASALLSSGLARADEGSTDAPTAVIQTADLNLASPAGMETLNGRVRRAANALCGTSHAVPLDSSARTHACRSELFRSADRQARVIARRGRVEILGTR